MAWRTGDANPAVARFVEIATATAAADGSRGDASRTRHDDHPGGRETRRANS